MESYNIPESEVDILKKSIEKAHSPLVLTDPQQDDNPLVYVNEAFENLTGYNKSYIIGQNCRFLQGDKTDPETVDQVRNAIESEEPITIEIRNYRKDGTMFWNELTIKPVYDEEGELIRFLGTQIDITNRKKHEQKLKQQRNNLEILNGVIRHDIRNDLQLVTGYANQLLNTSELVKANEAKDHITTIEECAQHAIEITETARNLSNVMLADSIETKQIFLKSILEKEVSNIQSEYPEAIITYETPIPAVSVTADEMLSSVFANLLKNAIDHNDKNICKVTVSASVTVSEPEGNKTALISIADNGPGIPDKYKETIFGKGEQGLKNEGTGIGLYLVQSLIENYGGDVWVEDNEPDGSVFIVQLPISE